MNRQNVSTLYSDLFEQLGAGKSNKDESKEDNKKNDFYIPSDLSYKSQNDLSKLFKINRMLQKELHETKQALLATTKELDLTKAQLEKAIKR